MSLEDFRTQVRGYLRAAGLTQEALAHAVGIHRVVLSNKLRGSRRAPLARPMIRAIVLALAAERALTMRAEVVGLLAALDLTADLFTAAEWATPPLSRLTHDPVAAGPPHRHNLPAPPTRLIGRTHETQAISNLLTTGAARLITLTGPGGTGKTRLALTVGHALSPSRRDGVFFVPLASLRDPVLVLPTIATALGVKEGSRPLIDTLTGWLRERDVLLVLDNFEQLLPAAPLLGTLLAGAPQLRLLVTSRALLHLYGEYEFVVPPLALPDLRHPPPVELLAQYPAVALFIQRAQAARTTFTLTPQNAPYVTDICARLDGLPLAIELAAARSKLFAPAALLAQLHSRLDLPAADSRDRDPRHQTLRTAIDWSYNLLDADEQALFAQLSVFAGGWTLAAAQAICAGEASDKNAVADLLQRLVDQSLVVVDVATEGSEDGAQSTWFRMLDSIREYAGEQLAARGDVQALRRRHALYYLTLVEAGDPMFRRPQQSVDTFSQRKPPREAAGDSMLRRPQQTAWLDRLEQEQDNLRLTLDWTLTHSMTETSTRLVAALVWFWTLSGHLSEGIQWLEAVLDGDSSDLPLLVQAMVWSGIASLANMQGNLTRAEQAGHAGLQLWRALDAQGGIGISLLILGWTALQRAEYRHAAQFCTESVALFRHLGDQWNVGLGLPGLGYALLGLGDHAPAAAVFGEKMALAQSFGNAWDVATDHTNLALPALVQGDWSQARQEYHAGLRRLRDLGPGQAAIECLDGVEGLALAALAAENAEDHGPSAPAGPTLPAGVKLLGAVAALRDTVAQNAVLPPNYHPHGYILNAIHAQRVAGAKDRLDARLWDEAWRQGTELTLAQAVDFAIHDAEQRL